MADEVKLITFAGETVSPLYDGLMQELYTGGGGIITGAAVTIKDASTLHITGGYGALCGREFEIFASDIPVTLSSSGTLKGRLYLHMDLSQIGSPIELLVEVAASLTPVVQDSDVNTTNGVYEVNLATFDVGTSAISNLQDVAPKAVKIPDALNSLNSALTGLSGKFVYVSGTMASAINTEVNIPYPQGFSDSSGFIIAGITSRNSNSYWYLNNPDVSCFGDNANVRVKTSNNGFLNQPFKVLLIKL